jgi:hypothetical protein
VSPSVTVEDALLAPVRPELHEVELLSNQWVKWVCDADGSGRLPGATCS